MIKKAFDVHCPVLAVASTDCRRLPSTVIGERFRFGVGKLNIFYGQAISKISGMIFAVFLRTLCSKSGAEEFEICIMQKKNYKVHCTVPRNVQARVNNGF